MTCDWPECFEEATVQEDNSEYCVYHWELNR